MNNKPLFLVGRFKEVPEKHIEYGDVTFTVENRPERVHLRRGTWRSSRGFRMEAIPDGCGKVPSVRDAIDAVAGWLGEHPDAGRASRVVVHAPTS